jgi:hypothetical protein
MRSPSMRSLALGFACLLAAACTSGNPPADAAPRLALQGTTWIDADANPTQPPRVGEFMLVAFFLPT